MNSYFLKFIEQTRLSKYIKGDYDMNKRLYHDLHIYGDVAESYIEILCDEYNVDITDFEFDDYFPPEFIGESMLERCFYCFFPFLRKRYEKNIVYKELTFKMIEEAIDNKQLV